MKSCKQLGACVFSNEQTSFAEQHNSGAHGSDSGFDGSLHFGFKTVRKFWSQTVPFKSLLLEVEELTEELAAEPTGEIERGQLVAGRFKRQEYRSFGGCSAPFKWPAMCSSNAGRLTNRQI